MNMQARTLFAGALLSLSCFAAQAQQPATTDAAVQADAQAVAQARNTDNDPHCLRYTGSFITASKNQRNERADARSQTATPKRPRCIYSAGRAYSQEDIRRTGAINLSDALRKLDPAIW